MAKDEPIQMIEKMDNNRKKYMGVILSLIVVFVIGAVFCYMLRHFPRV